MHGTVPAAMGEPLDLPADFGARLRAARAYKDDLSRDDFATRLATSGASASTLKNWEEYGKFPAILSRPTLVQRLAEVSGLPELFFWGRDHPTPIEERLTAIEQTLQRIQESQAAEVVRDLEAQKQLAEVEKAIRRLRPPPQR